MDLVLRKNLARRLRQMMDEAGMRQQDVADRCNISRAFVSMVLAEQKAATVDSLEKLAAGLRVPPEYLITSGDQSSSEHQQILHLYDRASPAVRAVLLQLLRDDK